MMKKMTRRMRMRSRCICEGTDRLSVLPIAPTNGNYMRFTLSEYTMRDIVIEVDYLTCLGRQNDCNDDTRPTRAHRKPRVIQGV